MADDVLDDDDWHVIAIYHELLEPIKVATGYLQGQPGSRHGSIWQVLPAFEKLLAHFERQRLRYPVTQPTAAAVREHGSQSQLTFSQNHGLTAQAIESQPAAQISFETHLSTNINLAWQKLNEYYYKLDDTSIYVAAVVLHPRMKWRWIEKQWQEVAHCKGTGRDLWIQPAKIAFHKRSLEYENKEVFYDGNSSAVVTQASSPRKRKRATEVAEYYNDVILDDESDNAAPRRKTMEQQIAEYNSEPRVARPQIVDSPIP